MNKIILLGRFTRDPEVRYTSTGKVVCQGTIAVDRPFVNQDGQHILSLLLSGANRLRFVVIALLRDSVF